MRDLIDFLASGFASYNGIPGAIFFGVFGAIFGSFANVIIYRMPAGESIVTPRSHCYGCKKIIPWYNNIPIVSWLILRGKCGSCGAKFSVRYLIVELITALLFSLCYVFAPSGAFLTEWIIFCFGLVVCTFIDFDHMILPDEFTLSGIVIGLLGSWLNPGREILPSFLGILLGGGFLWATAYIYYLLTKQEGMGGGDIKLLAWIGAVLGWQSIPFVIICSSIFGSFVGLVMTRKSNKGLKTVIPFGPYLALGALIFIFGGDGIGKWYFQFFLPL